MIGHQYLPTFIPLMAAAAAAAWPLAAFGWGSKAAEIDKLAPLMELKPGSVVAEIGAGNGAVTVAAAERVGPSGHVYSNEIDRDNLAKIRKRVAKAGFGNVTVIEARPDDTGLPAGCCDAVFMIGVYHHFSQPMQTDQSIFRALRPGGRLVIVDFRPSAWLWLWKPQDVPADRGGHGVPLEVTARELTQAGFVPEQTLEHWGSSWFLSSYCLVYRKPGGAAASVR
jgi:ubiquinone/menaquinone biosynthesis C-methylase UbiE